MQQPARLISTPFAQEGEKTDIQNVTGESDNSATYRVGFPPITMQSIRLGGKPPKGMDFNGVLFDITENISFLCKGGRYQYSAGLSTLIGGYPEGSNLLLDDNITEVVSEIASNQNNPNTNMTGWKLKPTKASSVLSDGAQNQQEINDFGGAKWYAKVGGYELGATVKLENGDTVKSTDPANTANPNIDMSGWVNPNDAPQLKYSLQKNKITQTIYDKLYQIWNPKDFGAIGDGALHTVQEWIDSGKFSGLAAVQVVYPHVTSVTDSIDWAAIQQLINGLPYSPVSTGNPKDGCNGGQSFVSRGQYFINRKFKIKRGLALKGESAESTQFWCLTTDGLFEYDDVGRYLSDELQLQDISLWQDPSVIPTSGAGIKIRSSGLVPEASVSPILRNLIIEGFYNNLDIGDCINLTMSNINQSKSISHGGIIDNVTFSTSSLLSSCYAHSCGASGWLLKKMYYVSLQGMASDSNASYGYELEDCRGVVLHGGAEANGNKALKLKNSYATNLMLSAVNNAEGAADIDASFYTAWSCGMLTDNRAGSTKVAITGLTGSNFLEITKGVDLEGSYTTNRITGINNYDDRALPTAIASNGKNWQLGVNQALQTLSQFFFGGLASETTQNGLDLQTNFSKSVGSINKTLNIVFRAVSPDTFANAVGQYIGNGIISGGGTIARKIGQVINKQTGGTSANAHIHLTDADAALPVGNWSLMNNSADPSYFQKIKIGATPSTAPTWTSGTGVPVSVEPAGSIYTRIDGGTTTTLYIREGSAWVAK